MFRHSGTDRDKVAKKKRGTRKGTVMKGHILSSKLGFSSRAGMGMGMGAALVIATKARETARVMERMRMLVNECVCMKRCVCSGVYVECGMCVWCKK